MSTRSVHAVTLVAACVLVAGTLTTKAQIPDAAKAKPPDAPASGVLVSTGHALFLSNCAPCHGANAQGDDGPNLHKLGLPNDTIALTVSTGVKNEMPSFEKKLKENDLKAIVSYVHTLQ